MAETIHFEELINGDMTVENVVKLIKEKSPRDLQTFVKTCLVDALMKNTDRHGKNLAFLYDNGKYKLSPIYDNVCWAIYRKNDYNDILNFKWGGHIATKNESSPLFEDYIVEFARLGISTRKFVSTIQKKIKTIKNIIDKSKLSVDKKFVLKELIDRDFVAKFK